MDHRAKVVLPAYVARGLSNEPSIHREAAMERDSTDVTRGTRDEHESITHFFIV
ncbi:MAG: hypothetical protein ACK5T6_10605 [Pirellula sp.]